MRRLWITLRETVRLRRRALCAWPEARLLALIDAYLARRGEQRAPLEPEIDVFPVLYDGELPSLVDEDLGRSATWPI